MQASLRAGAVHNIKASIFVAPALDEAGARECKPLGLPEAGEYVVVFGSPCAAVIDRRRYRMASGLRFVFEVTV